MEDDKLRGQVFSSGIACQSRPQFLGAKVLVEHVHRASIMGVGQHEVGSSKGGHDSAVVISG